MRLQSSVQYRPRSDAGQFVAVKIAPAVLMAVTEASELIRDTAQALCPVDTGALRDSITSEVSETGKTVLGRVSPHVSYAAFVEFGTGIRGAESAGAGDGPYSATWPGMPAQPYMRPAYDEGRQLAIDIMGTHVGAALV